MNDKTNREPVQIFLVEDNSDDISLCIEALKETELPNNVVVRSDGAAALDYLKSGDMNPDYIEPDMVLLDLKLPKVSGIEVLRQIKTDERLKEIPVIVLSASDNDEDIQAAYRNHANCYVVKPVEFQRFIDIVKNIQEFWYQIARLPKSK